MTRLQSALWVFASAGVWAGGLAGCSTEQLTSVAVRPAKYSIYNCEQLATAGAGEVKRESELKSLMEKAAQGPGGGLAIAVAYRNEYLVTQGNLRELEAAAVEKKCKMPWRTISEQAVR